MNAQQPALTAHAAWRVDNARWLALSLEAVRLRMRRRALWLARPDSDWLVCSAHDEAAFLNADPEALRARAALSAVLAERDDLERAMGEARPALRRLGEVFGLSGFEEDVLLLAAAPGLDGAFAGLLAEPSGVAVRCGATLQVVLALLVDGVVDRTLSADCLVATCTLRSRHLVDLGEEDGGPVLSRPIAVDERITDYLRGVNRLDLRVAGVLEPVAPRRSSPDEPPLHGSVEELAAELAATVAREKEWLTIDLLGSVAGGARELAALTCARLGLGLCVADIARIAAFAPSERDTLVRLLGREVTLGSFALLLEVDSLDRGGPAAAVVDQLIRRTSTLVFVLGQERWPGDHRGLTVPVRWPSRDEQARLWRRELGADAAPLGAAIDAVVQQFDFGPPAIRASAARATVGVAEPPDRRRLWDACRVHGAAGLDELASRIDPVHGWPDIVLRDDQYAQLREIASQVEQRTIVYEAWGFGPRLKRGRGITALFAGASGTGKTMSAEILAGHLALDLFRVDLAGVVSKYIGETEKNLRRVFDAAERTGAILLFDEADALFGSRTEVRDSHDRYANVEVNYLLQRMEDYTGLAILATNRRAALDTAFIRRLRFILEFPFPGPQERRKIWERVFPAQAKTEALDHAALARLELAGGSIRAIAINAAFLAASDRAAIGMAHVMRAAAREYSKLSRPITPGEFGPWHARAQG